MVSVSHLVQKYVSQKPLLMEGISQDVISFTHLADQLHPVIEKELGKKAHLPAIIMALRRFSESMKKKEYVRNFDFHSEIVMKTNLCDICVVKTPSLFKKINKLYDLVDSDKGDTLNIIQGNYEVTFVFNEKHLGAVKKALSGEKILNVEKNLVSLALSYPNEFLHTPGIIARASRTLFWENINVFEIVSTMTELNFIIAKGDATKAYEALQGLFGES
ncbi:hypothetical protein HZB01_00575 [Candidatus Woesearchaeota archaeon]|nr:hypothetical protein [Candidatus Woesearchaeota archaeon]